MAATPTRPARAGRISETISENPAEENLNSEALCQIHNAPKDVFCTTCASTICHKCGCFSILHRGHDLKPLSEVHEEVKRRVLEKIDAVKVRNDELELLITDYDRNAEEIRTAKEQLLVEIQNFVTERIKGLEDIAKTRNLKIEQYRRKLRDEIEKNKISISQVQRETDSLERSDLLRKRNEIQSTLDELVKVPISNFVFEPVSSQFQDDLYPKWSSGTFTVENFEDELASNTPIYSGSIHQYGMTWQLKLYPNGNDLAQNSHLSVFLQLSNATPLHSSAKYTYKFSVLDRHDKEICEKEFTSEFAIGECWGYNRYLSLNRVRMLLVDGDLKLKFSVRPETYPVGVRDMENYMNFIRLGGTLADDLEQHPLNESNAADRSYMLNLTSDNTDDEEVRSTTSDYLERVANQSRSSSRNTNSSNNDDRVQRPNSAPTVLSSSLSFELEQNGRDVDEIDTYELLYNMESIVL